ncbi:MAG: flagellar biosynthetic protein FliR [Alphaproteobacteria bacterium]
MNVAEILPLFTFQFFLVFARLGTAMFVFPSLSDPAINTRARLLLGLAISLILYPLLSTKLPALPVATGDMLTLLATDMLIGLMMGLGARIMMGAMNLAGELIAFMSGLQAASLFDPTSGANTAAPTVLLTLAAGLLVLALNLHHQLILGIVASYKAFPPGSVLATGDMLTAIVTQIGKLMLLGVQLSAPVMVVGFLTYLMFGIFNRLIPQLQVFFLSVPLAIALSLVVMAASFTLILGLFTTSMQDNLFLFNTEEPDAW